MNRKDFIAAAIACALRKGGVGSGNFNHAGIPGQQGGSMPGDGNNSHPNAKAHPRNKGALSGDTREAANLRTKEVSAWARENGVTGASTLSSISRGLKRGQTLDEAVQSTYRRIDRNYQKQFGKDLYQQMRSEGKIKYPKGVSL